MEPSLLSAEYVDSAKTAAFIAACLFNRQAIIVVAFHLAGELLFDATSMQPIIYFCLAASLYSCNAAINISLAYSVRQALICIGCINWLAAVDFYVTDRETLFYLCYPWLINGLDMLILCLLLGGGGRNIVGTYRPWHRRVARL